MEGYWFGEGAESLGLSGAKDQDHWKSICANKHPFTGEKLTGGKLSKKDLTTIHFKKTQVIDTQVSRLNSNPIQLN